MGGHSGDNSSRENRDDPGGLGCLVGLAQAREKDHSADYQVGTFSSTGTISDGSYANCSGGGCSAYSAAHNIHYVSTADGVYAIEAPTSVAGTMLVGMMSGGNAPTIHKGWFMDNLHEGDKVLFAAKCKTYRNNHTSCQFWLPNPDKTGKEILTMGGFSPAVAKTNTSQLCGTARYLPAWKRRSATQPPLQRNSPNRNLRLRPANNLKPPLGPPCNKLHKHPAAKR